MTVDVTTWFWFCSGPTGVTLKGFIMIIVICCCVLLGLVCHFFGCCPSSGLLTSLVFIKQYLEVKFSSHKRDYFLFLLKMRKAAED